MRQLEERALPEWAFLDAHSHLGDELSDRTLILHVRSASVIEIIDADNDGFIPVEGVLMFNFQNIGAFGVVENLIAILHYCQTLDFEKDKQFIIKEILKPCAMWYCDYCEWEDKNIIEDL